jgi:predicted Zn-dependent protease
VNRFDDAKATYQQALGHNLSSPFFHQELYQIAFVQNDLEEMTHQVAWSTGKPWAEDILLSLNAETAAYSGRLREAREISRRAVDTALRTGEKEAAARYIVQSAVREALLGNAEEARKRASSAMGLAAGRDVQYGAALAFAFAGKDQKARSLIHELAKRFPEDTIVQFNYLPTLRAKLALNQGKISEALETLEIATPYELGGTTGSSYGWNALFPVFVRGEAYLGAENGRQAAAEFRKIIDHRGIVVNEPIGALAYRSLARAYTFQGNKPKARAAYQDFLTLWKDADPDIPVLKQAKAEFDTLR